MLSGWLEISSALLVEKYASKASEFAKWLEYEIPEGLTVFNLAPDSIGVRRKLRTTNMVEFQNKELKKGQDVLNYFPTKNLCSESQRRF